MLRRRILGLIRSCGLMPLINWISNLRYAVIKLFAKIFKFNPFEFIYNKKFYDDILAVDKETKSSEKLAKAIKLYLKPKSVIDVGCGIGIYLKPLDLSGISCFGIEGSSIARKYSVFNKNRIIVADVTRKLNINKKYDLALCIEVAEHIPKKTSSILIGNLTSLSNIILFTSAPPGQGGTDHINEQKPQFWINLFNKKNFVFDKEKTEQIKNFLIQKKCIWWIPANMMIFKKRRN